VNRGRGYIVACDSCLTVFRTWRTGTRTCSGRCRAELSRHPERAVLSRMREGMDLNPFFHAQFFALRQLLPWVGEKAEGGWRFEHPYRKDRLSDEAADLALDAYLTQMAVVWIVSDPALAARPVA